MGQNPEARSSFDTKHSQKPDFNVNQATLDNPPPPNRAHK